jgi:exopolysaccharide production protein ExoZ
MKKINAIQVLRGLAAISVVLYHLPIIEKKYSGGDTWLPQLLETGRSGVDLFFVISGFIMFTITQPYLGGGMKSREFLWRRFVRIYPNYWFYLFITLAVFLVQPAYVNASQGSKFNFLHSFLLLPSETLPLLLVAWSLTFEVFFYCVFAVLLKFRQRTMMVCLVGWLLFLVIANLFIQVKPQPLIELLISPYPVEFICGAFAAWLVSKQIIQRKTTVLLSVVSALIIILLPYLYQHYYGGGYFSGRRALMQMLIFGPAYSVILLAMVSLEKLYKVNFPKLLVVLGDVSYTLYLSQLLVMGAIGRLWAAWFQYPGTMIDNLLVCALILVALIVYSLLAYKYIERPSYNLFMRLAIFRKPVPELAEKNSGRA